MNIQEMQMSSLFYENLFSFLWGLLNKFNKGKNQNQNAIHTFSLHTYLVNLKPTMQFELAINKKEKSG